MHHFLGIVRYEYRMSVQRWGFWLSFGLLFLFYGFTVISPGGEGDQELFTGRFLWEYAGRLVFMTNLFMPVVGGIVAADRMVRDERLGVEELLRSTGHTRWQYILGKYTGVLLSVLTPVFLFVFSLSLLSMISGAPPAVVPITLLAFLAVAAPAYAFITIFSLACPLVMPVRVYQVLFTGYWFWGNFLTPNFVPTLSGTLLTPGGRYALEGFFGVVIGVGNELEHSTADAFLNLGVLTLCVLLAMVALERFLSWRAKNT